MTDKRQITLAELDQLECDYKDVVDEGKVWDLAIAGCSYEEIKLICENKGNENEK